VSGEIDTVVLDLDGTLVDSVYVHAACWKRAFHDVGLDIATYRIHRAIGMGGDRLVTEVAGAATEKAVGDKVRNLHGHHLDERFGEIVALDGASALLAAIDKQGLKVVLASSSDRELTDRLLDLVEGSWRLSVRISGGETAASKPAPDPIELALRRVDASGAVVIGDSVWDVESASGAGVVCVGVLTGGFSAAELHAAGALMVVDGPRSLADDLEAVLAAARPDSD
jgi:HAD superfamily hydrolase (TIGR01549 family)